MRDWLIRKLGGVPQSWHDEITGYLDKARDSLIEVKRAKASIIEENVELKSQLHERNKSFHDIFLWYKNNVVVGDLNEDIKPLMPTSMNAKAYMDTVYDDTFRLSLSLHRHEFCYILDPDMPVSEAGYLIEKMVKSLISAAELELRAQGLTKLRNYLNKDV